MADLQRLRGLARALKVVRLAETIASCFWARRPGAHVQCRRAPSRPIVLWQRERTPGLARHDAAGPVLPFALADQTPSPSSGSRRDRKPPAVPTRSQERLERNSRRSSVMPRDGRIERLPRRHGERLGEKGSSRSGGEISDAEAGAGERALRAFGVALPEPDVRASASRARDSAWSSALHVEEHQPFGLRRAGPNSPVSPPAARRPNEASTTR